jgi:hypothetical protein
MTNGLQYHTKEADQHKKEMKEKPNTPKKANTGSTKLPLPIATQLYWKRGSEHQQQKAGPDNRPKPPPVHITDIKNI